MYYIEEKKYLKNKIEMHKKLAEMNTTHTKD